MRRHPLRFLMGVLLLVGIGSYAVWIGRVGGQDLPFETLDQGMYSPKMFEQERNPSLLILTNQQDVDKLLQNILRFDPDFNRRNPSFADRFRQIDFDQFFVILARQGEEKPGAGLVIQRVSRWGNQVTVQAHFTTRFGGPTEVVIPFHSIAVRKDGLRGPNIHFKLTNGWFVVAETTQAVP